MKLVAIADLFIPKEYMLKGFKPLEKNGVSVEAIEWKLDNFEVFQNINLNIEKNGCEAIQTPEYIIEKIKDADIIITHFCPITKKVIEQNPKLKLIGVLRGGYENVNFARALERNIMIFNTPGRNSEAVSDFTVGLLICECRNIARAHFSLKNGVWMRKFPNEKYIPDLREKTVGIIGLGEIGLKVAGKLSGFEMNLLGYDPYVSSQKAEQYGVKLVDLQNLLKESDFVTLHARLTKETERMIGVEELKLMKSSAYLINTSRSGLVDEGALYDALLNKAIQGAAIDVFNREPVGKDYPLVGLDNITVTPHIAGGTTDAFYNTPIQLCEDLHSLWKKDAKPRNLINKDSFRSFWTAAAL